MTIVAISNPSNTTELQPISTSSTFFKYLCRTEPWLPISVFPMGTVKYTSKVQNAYVSDAAFEKFLYQSMTAYAMGGAGAMCEVDDDRFERALREGTPIFAYYHNPDDEEMSVYVTTTADRETTHVFFPDDFHEAEVMELC